MRGKTAEATPGPWHAHDFTEDGGDVTVSLASESYIEIAHMGGGLGGTRDEARANATHIAAMDPATATALIGVALAAISGKGRCMDRALKALAETVGAAK
jgi:hypothetical protein